MQVSHTKDAVSLESVVNHPFLTFSRAPASTFAVRTLQYVCSAPTSGRRPASLAVAQKPRSPPRCWWPVEHECTCCVFWNAFECVMGFLVEDRERS